MAHAALRWLSFPEAGIISGARPAGKKRGHGRLDAGLRRFDQLALEMTSETS